MKIRTKLLVGFGSLMLLMMIITTLSYDRMKDLNGNQDSIYHKRYENLKRASVIKSEVNRIARSLVNFLLSDTNGTEEDRIAMNRSMKQINEVLEQFQKNSYSDYEKKLTDQAVENGDRFFDYVSEMVTLLGKGQKSEAEQLRNNVGILLQDRLLEIASSLSNHHEKAVDRALEQSSNLNGQAVNMMAGITCAGIMIGFCIMYWIIYSISRGLNVVTLMMDRFAKGQTRTFKKFNVQSKDEFGDVARVFQSMALDLEHKSALEEEYYRAREDQAWIKSNMARVTELLKDVTALPKAAQTFISEFTPIFGASYGAFYVIDDMENDRVLHLRGTYAFHDAQKKFFVGEGLVGQCAVDKRPIMLDELPPDYITISSGLGDTAKVHLLLQPVCYEKRTIGVIEIASLRPFSPLVQELLRRLADNMGIVMNSIHDRVRLQELLRKSQALTEELQCQSEELLQQQEELKSSNDKLEQQTVALKRSEELLQRQQEELERSNEELMMKTRLLEEQIAQTNEKNEQLEWAKKDLEKQAIQLAMASKYKSEFLANMSHELRTPLNSLLILSQLLADNKDGNLTSKQIEYAQTIHASGSDLLKLIDEILEWSKVDAGKTEINQENAALAEIGKFVGRSFSEVAAQKGLDFHVHIDSGLPKTLFTDSHRVKQVLKNLLSNAFKFTSTGSIAFRVYAVDCPAAEMDSTDTPRKCIAFSVSDTGIGIPEDKKDIIFEAFQQADGTTSRKYGGTGLGLSISRELAYLLGGKITVESVETKGSVFTLFLPLDGKLPPRDASPYASSFARIEAAAGTETVMAQILQDKDDPNTKRLDETALILQKDEKLGHWELLRQIDRKDAVFEGKNVLLVDDDIRNVYALSSVLESCGMNVYFAENGREALDHMDKQPDIDLVLMDMMMPEMDGYTTMKMIREQERFEKLPIIALTAKAMKDDRQKCIEAGASDYAAKPIDTDQLISLLRVWLYK